MSEILEVIDHRVVTSADVEAYQLVQRALGGDYTAADDAYDIIEAADKIIFLAEKIKAQRLTAAMQSVRLRVRVVHGRDL